VFNDDILVPAEIMIHFSKKAAGWLAVGGLLIAAYGLFLYDKSFGVFGRWVLEGLAAFLLFKALKEYFTKAPQIIINSEGIQTAKTRFYPWSDIKNEDTQTIVRGIFPNRISNIYLVYNYPGGTEKLRIDDMAISGEQLLHLLHVYRTRSESVAR